MNIPLRKDFWLSLIALLMPLVNYAEDYPIAFDRNADRTRTDRMLNGIYIYANKKYVIR